MIKILKITALVFLMLTVCVCSVIGAEQTEATIENYKIQLYINDAPVELENKPFFYESNVYVPLRELSDALGIPNDENNKILWDNGKVTMFIAGHSHYYEMKIGENKIMLRPYDTSTHYDAWVISGNSPVLMNNTTYIPFSYTNSTFNGTHSDPYSQTPYYGIKYTFGNITSNVPYRDNAESLTYDAIREIQYETDNGYYPYRLDPKEAIHHFFYINDVLSGGTISDFSEGTFKCTGTYSKNGLSVDFEVFNPLQRENGIWVVKSLKFPENAVPTTVTIENVELYDGDYNLLTPDTNWYTVGKTAKASIYTTGLRANKITAYYTDSGTEMEQYKQIVGELIPKGDADIVELTFDNDVHGHLWFVLDLGTHQIESERYCVTSENI